jgi:flavin reductase (DIM6/NTAB) family NADH-FMN oxidoreductase RutF
MDFPWGSEYHQKFITNVGLITSDGPNGPNIMAAEWTYLVSYTPGQIIVAVGPNKATGENILATKKFGVSIASEKQNWVASIAGGSSGHQVNKIDALKEMGVKFVKGKKLDQLLVEGSSLMAEVKVTDILPKGSHTLFIGDVIDARTTSEKPLAFHQNKYWKMDTLIEKPSDEKRAEMKAIVENHSKKK